MYQQGGFLTCPNPYCRCRDRLQKVSAIVAAGTSTSSFDGYVHGYHNTYRTRSRSESRTVLAQRLSPPPRPAYRSPWGCLTLGLAGFLLISFLMGLFLCLALLQTPTDTNMASPVIFLLIFSAVWLIPLIFLIRSQNRAASKRMAQLNAEIPRWQYAYARWDQLYYCHNCDNVFLMDQTRWCPATEMYSLL